MDNVISLDEYRKKKNIELQPKVVSSTNIESDDYINSEQYFKDLSEFMKEQDLYDRFYDYVGEGLYDRIKNGEHISQEELELWGCDSVQDFLDTWRGNSEEEYQKWLIEHGYKTE